MALGSFQRLQSRPLRLALHEYVRDNFYTIKNLPLAHSCAFGKIVLSGHSHTKQMYAFLINGPRQGEKISKLRGNQESFAVAACCFPRGSLNFRIHIPLCPAVFSSSPSVAFFL